MCGRVRSTLGADQVAAASGGAAWKNPDQYEPRYNASPGASLAVIRRAESGESTSDRVVETMRFGLVPSFTDPGAKVDFYRMFNARSETIAEKGVFSRLLQRRRGVVLINGFYEWAAERAGSSQVKQPYYLHLEGKGGGSEGDVLRCAALYDRWKGGTGGELVTVTIITVEASEPLRWLHDRMPAVLRTDADVAVWLEGSDDRPSSAAGLLVGRFSAPANPAAPSSIAGRGHYARCVGLPTRATRERRPVCAHPIDPAARRIPRFRSARRRRPALRGRRGTIR